MKKSYAIILSAGKGTRMKSKICKQYIQVNNRPVLFYALSAFEKSDIDNIVIVAGADDINYIKSEIVDKYSFKKVISIVQGGKERYNSVMNGLNEIGDEGFVLIHDGARPLIETSVINHIISELNNYEACIAGMPVKDTIKIVNQEGFVETTPLRELIWQIQTPQAFKINVIKDAYREMSICKDETITDDAMVVEKYSDVKVKLIEAGYTNIKITTPEDLVFMKSILDSQKNAEK